MSKVMKSFICRGCLNAVSSLDHTSVSANLQLVDKLCYLGDMLSVDGDADADVEASIQHTHTHNRFTALWNLSGKTRVSRYQKNIHPLLSS